MSEDKLYLYPTWVRVWHAINAISILVLIYTGLSMQYGNINNPFIRFDQTIRLHNFFGVLMVISYLGFLILNTVFGNIKHYKQHLSGMLARLTVQATYYLSGYFKGEPKPFKISEKNKFNPLQHIAYVIAMYVFVPIMALSGLALLYPDMIVERIFNLSGIQVTAFVHVLMGIFLVLFLLVHLYVASIGKHPLKNYKSIVTGYHEE